MDMPASEFTSVEITGLIDKRGAVEGEAERLLWYVVSAVPSGILAALLCGVVLLLAGF